MNNAYASGDKGEQGNYPILEALTRFKENNRMLRDAAEIDKPGCNRILTEAVDSPADIGVALLNLLPVHPIYYPFICSGRNWRCIHEV